MKKETGEETEETIGSNWKATADRLKKAGHLVPATLFMSHSNSSQIVVELKFEKP